MRIWCFSEARGGIHGKRDPDFRSVDGLYHQTYDYPPEQILSHSFFMRNPDYFFSFYQDKSLALDAKPNAAHRKLAELEAAGKLKAVITQNIDGLHQLPEAKKYWSYTEACIGITA